MLILLLYLDCQSILKTQCTILIICKPLADEFLIGYGEDDKGDDRGWFVLTNYNLIIKDGVSFAYQTIKLTDIESYKLSDDVSVPCVFNLKTGSSLKVNKVEQYPDEKYLQFAIDLNNATMIQ